MTTNDPRMDALEHDLEAAFAVPVPELRFEDALTNRATVAPRHGRAWRYGAAAAVAAGLFAAVAFLPGYLGGAETVSAEELVIRSAAATSAVNLATTNYHMITVNRSAGNETVTEHWYGGPERNRSESRSTFANGQTSIEGSATLGDELWMYNDQGGALRVAHGPRFLNIAIPSIPTLADHIGAWTNDNCFSAEVTGKERLNGRQAHVLTILSTPETCPYEPKPLKKATLWIDAENDMAVKMVYEGDGPGDNSSFELSLFETFESLPDSAFVYSPPVGTEVVEFTTQAELKNIFVVIVPRGSHVVMENDWSVELTPVAANETPGP